MRNIGIQAYFINWASPLRDFWQKLLVQQHSISVLLSREFRPLGTRVYFVITQQLVTTGCCEGVSQEDIFQYCYTSKKISTHLQKFIVPECDTVQRITGRLIKQCRFNYSLKSYLICAWPYYPLPHYKYLADRVRQTQHPPS